MSQNPLQGAEWFKPGPSTLEFLKDHHFVRVLVGGRGSSKTFGGVCADLVNHCWEYAGAKCNIVRLTEASQKDSTVDTFWKFFAKMGELYQDRGLLFRAWNNGRTFRLPSALAVKRLNEVSQRLTSRADIVKWIEHEGAKLCGIIEMRGIPDKVTSESKFRGMECSRMVFVEADQMNRADFNLSLACLRWAGTDPETCNDQGFILDQGAIVDTNPPGKKHWIAQMEEEQMALPEEKREMRFWHISTYENEANLPPGYIERQILLPYANNPAMITRMLWGQYADAFDGNAVYYNFSQRNHVWMPKTEEDKEFGMAWPSGVEVYLIEGFDFGTCNATVWFAYWQENGENEFIHVFAENYVEGSDTDRQGQQAIQIRKREFEFWNDRALCAGILSFCDPAGEDGSTYTASHNSAGQKTRNHADILRTHGIAPGSLLWQRGVQKGAAVINRFLQKKTKNGTSCFRIDGHRCPMLTAALSGGYRYPQSGEPGFGGEEPMKGTSHQETDYSHIADAFRYAALNVLKLMKAEFEQTKPPNFAQRNARSLNPRRRL